MPEPSVAKLLVLLPPHLSNYLDVEQLSRGHLFHPKSLHFVRAYAGTGKTQIGKVYVWLVRRHSGALPTPTGATDSKRLVALWLVRTKVLREEIIHDLLDGVLDASEIFVA
ncbi:MAG: hypothetical protein ACKPKO_07885, partial [Candidatus Fonsibacter sp.]